MPVSLKFEEKIFEFINKSCIWKVANGEKVRYLEDIWMQDFLSYYCLNQDFVAFFGSHKICCQNSNMLF